MNTSCIRFQRFELERCIRVIHNDHVQCFHRVDPRQVESILLEMKVNTYVHTDASMKLAVCGDEEINSSALVIAAADAIPDDCDHILGVTFGGVVARRRLRRQFIRSASTVSCC